MVEKTSLKSGSRRLHEFRWLAYCAAALLIAPAATVLSLYPMNWLLGTVNFNPLAVNIGAVRLYAILPLLVIFLFAVVEASRALVTMLVTGLLLILSTPNIIGAVEPPNLDRTSLYPEAFSAVAVDARLSGLEVARRGWMIQTIPPRVPSTSKALEFKAVAVNAVDVWKGALSNDAAKAKYQGEIEGLKAQRSGLNRDWCRANRFGIFCHGKILETQAILDAQIASIQGQLNAVAAARSATETYPAAASATAAVAVELEFLERSVLEKEAFVLSLPYLLAASASFILLIATLGFLNVAFLAVVLVTFAFSASAVWPLTPDARLLQVWLIVYPPLFVTLSGFVLRFLVRSYLDNSSVLIEFGQKPVVRAAFWTSLVWLPFPLLVIGVLWVNNRLYQQISDAIYCEAELVKVCGSTHAVLPIHDSDPARDTLRDDVQSGILRMMAVAEVQGVSAASGVASNAPDQVEKVKAAVLDTYRRVLPDNVFEIFPGLTPPSCAWYQIKCHVKRYALSELNRAYQRPRNEYLVRLDARLTQVAGQIVAGASTASAGFRDVVQGQSRSAALYITRSVDLAFIALNSIALLQMAYMLLVINRAYLLGFGRILYRSSPSPAGGHDGSEAEIVYPYLTLTHVETSPTTNRNLKVRAFEEGYEIGGDDLLPLLANRKYDADDSEQVTSLVRCHRVGWPLRRLVNGCLFLRRVRRKSNKPSIKYNFDGDRQVIVWTLPKQATVFFRWDRFVAISESCAIGKRVSLRIGGLSTGTVMQATATGPGLLLLEALGHAEIARLEKVPGSVLTHRVVSWLEGSRFQIASAREFAAAYLDQSSLDPEPRSYVVTQSASGTGGGLGILRDFIMLLKP